MDNQPRAACESKEVVSYDDRLYCHNPFIDHDTDDNQDSRRLG